MGNYADMSKRLNLIKEGSLYVAWIQSIAAMVGSYYFSEIRHFTPCNLCWYQRIFMFPLVIIIAVGILKKDKDIYKYVLPLSIIGWFVAFYQVLLEKGIIKENLLPCTIGAACTTKYINYLGFITIPLLSLLAFSLITICMVIFWRLNQKKN